MLAQRIKTATFLQHFIRREEMILYVNEYLEGNKVKQLGALWIRKYHLAK